MTCLRSVVLCCFRQGNVGCRRRQTVRSRSAVVATQSRGSPSSDLLANDPHDRHSWGWSCAWRFRYWLLNMWRSTFTFAASWMASASRVDSPASLGPIWISTRHLQTSRVVKRNYPNATIIPKWANLSFCCVMWLRCLLRCGNINVTDCQMMNATSLSCLLCLGLLSCS